MTNPPSKTHLRVCGQKGSQSFYRTLCGKTLFWNTTRYTNCAGDVTCRKCLASLGVDVPAPSRPDPTEVHRALARAVIQIARFSQHTPMTHEQIAARLLAEFDISPRDESGWREEECIRTSGDLVCDRCGMEYWRHPSVAKEAPTLVRACDGRLLKL